MPALTNTLISILIITACGCVNTNDSVLRNFTSVLLICLKLIAGERDDTFSNDASGGDTAW